VALKRFCRSIVGDDEAARATRRRRPS